MSKRVIVLVVDSLSYESVNGTYKHFSAPFLTKLAKENFTATRMYSEAPYTEAAVGALMAGQHTLDYGGYLYGFDKSPVNIFEAFRRNGYRVYNSSNTPHMHTDIWMRGVDDTFYHGTPNSAAIRSYRMRYYEDLFRKSKIEDSDYEYIEDLIEGFFKNQISMIHKIKAKSQETELINEAITGYDYEKVLQEWCCEEIEFNKNRRDYCKKLVSGEKEKFYELPNLTLNSKIKSEIAKDKFVEIFEPIYKKIYKKQKKLNERNTKYNLRIVSEMVSIFLKFPNRVNFRNILKAIYLNYEAKHRFEMKKRFTREYGSFKDAPSFMKHYKHLVEWEEKNREKNTLAYLHFDDFHWPSVFYTYDSEDESLLREEANYILEYLATLPKNYKGNIVTDLSLLYVDRQLESFFNELEQRKLLEDTIILITADHGYPYNLYPIREDYANAMYLENYHIPCIIVKEGLKGECRTFQSSYDIPVTLCDLVNIEKPKEFVGESIIKEHEGRKQVVFEYLGGGCPDMTRRPIHYGCFDDELFIKVVVPLKDEISTRHLTKVFDLKKDPIQYKNLVKRPKKYFEKIRHLIKVLNERHKNIIK